MNLDINVYIYSVYMHVHTPTHAQTHPSSIKKN